jgi:Spy/CpxP family protein refolding chaperone
MKRSVVVSTVVVVVLALAVSAGAVVKKKGRGMHRPMQSWDMACGCDGAPMERLKALGLDEKQTEAVTAIHLKTKKEMIRKRADIRVAEIDLREALSKEPVDMQAVEALVKKIEGLKADALLTHVKAREEIKTQLTPEQRKKFGGMMMGPGPMGPMGRGYGMHGGCGMRDGGTMGPVGPGMMDDEDMPPMRHGFR